MYFLGLNLKWVINPNFIYCIEIWNSIIMCQFWWVAEQDYGQEETIHSQSIKDY